MLKLTLKRRVTRLLESALWIHSIRRPKGNDIGPECGSHKKPLFLPPHPCSGDLSNSRMIPSGSSLFKTGEITFGKSSFLDGLPLLMLTDGIFQMIAPQVNFPNLHFLGGARHNYLFCFCSQMQCNFMLVFSSAAQPLKQ